MKGGIEGLRPWDSMYGRGVALVALSTVTWGSGGLFVRLLPYDSATVVVWRGIFGVLFVGIFLLWQAGARLRNVFRHIGPGSALISVSSAVGITIFPAAAQHTSVANVFIILGTLPFLAAAVAWVWIRERPSRATLVASALALVGIALMLGPTSGGPRLGDFLAICATVTQAIMTVAIRRYRIRDILPLAWLSIVLSIFMALPLAHDLTALTGRDYVIAAGFGLIPMTFGMTLYMVGSGLIPAPLTALIGTLEAPIGAIWAWVGVGEVPTIMTFVGGGVVLGSVIGRFIYEWVVLAGFGGLRRFRKRRRRI